jgi:hypothetical protein
MWPHFFPGGFLPMPLRSSLKPRTMSAAVMCFAALTSTSNSAREGFLITVVAALAVCGLFSLAMIVKAHRPLGCIFTPNRMCSSQSCVEIRKRSGQGDATVPGALNRILLDRYFRFTPNASPSIFL